ncbi:DUF6659 family protein [Nitrosopumilus sp.]|uniref:Roadblock/LAMTOR2 domain-containing protein n=2 Tax=Nitrosopumilus zosterae TaxID=718286 RepID=A0A2S2KSA2_9ARCH|nr:DUF6659 family protein [Nitrosopumilus sp.]GBH34494.1 hypothetical protein NZNM25_12850 [Nitrosopumilus zosterae]
MIIMALLTAKEIKKLDDACLELSKDEKVRHVGIINEHGRLIAGGFKKGKSPLIKDEKISMTYMQMQLDFKMRKELDDVLGPIDYIASRRTKQLIISVPIGDNLILISAEPDADDKQIIKKAEELFDDITISTI